MQSLNVGGRLISLENPLVMGVLNLTADSFFDGGKYDQIDKAIDQVAKMVNEGARIIDIGASSSRPGASISTPEDELVRLSPVLEELKVQFPDLTLSIDTYHHQVVRKLSDSYAFIANDINASHQGPEYLECVSQNAFPYVCMHMQGQPDTMQSNPQYDDVTYDILNFFSDKVYSLQQIGIDQVILDVGFGFGKTLDHNYELLKKLNVFNILDKPVLAGLSRKSMIYKHLNVTPTAALNGTTALNMVALINGARILRVHDVKEAVETINLWAKLR